MATTAANYWLLCISAVAEPGRASWAAAARCLPAGMLPFVFFFTGESLVFETGANKLIFQSLLTRDSEISQALVKSAKNKRKQRLNESAKVFYDRP